MTLRTKRIDILYVSRLKVGRKSLNAGTDVPLNRCLKHALIIQQAVYGAVMLSSAAGMCAVCLCSTLLRQAAAAQAAVAQTAVDGLYY